MSNPVGRPPYYASVEELQEKIDAYFATTIKGEYTITGLALALGFSQRKSLIDYEGNSEFLHTIKTAKLRIEQDYEYTLRKLARSGDIFGLKNFDWKDKSEHEVGSDPNKPLKTEMTIKLVE